MEKNTGQFGSGGFNTGCWTVYSFSLILLPKLQAMKSVFKILLSVTL